jgi:hypothetical protein
MLTTVLTPSEGRLRVAGHDPVKEPLLVRRAFGIVFQDPSLDGELTATENMELHGVLYRVPRAPEPGSGRAPAWRTTRQPLRPPVRRQAARVVTSALPPAWTDRLRS